MNRGVALKIVLGLVGSLFLASTLAIRNPLANRNLIAFTHGSSFAHAVVRGTQTMRNMVPGGELMGVAILILIGLALIALAPARQRAAPAFRLSSIYQRVRPAQSSCARR